MWDTWLFDNRTTSPTPVLAQIEIDFLDVRFWDVELAWKPERARLSPPPQHSHWDWVRKIGSLRLRFVGVTIGVEVQGLMAVARAFTPSELSPGKQALYVEFLESAPWNLKEHPDGVRYRGVGKTLLAAAVQMSLDAGMGGRVGLSALPQAVGFYSHCGMTACGRHHGMVYFEYSEQAGCDFLAQTRGTP